MSIVVRKKIMGQEQIALSIDFSAFGNSERYKKKGWYEPEAGFAWTSGTMSSLEFPRPRQEGRYVLEMKVSPFVWKSAVPQQRLIVFVNDAEVGYFFLDHEDVLRCEVPWSLLNKKPSVIVDLQVPDAAKPYEINGVPDTRSIAVAFDEFSLLRMQDDSGSAHTSAASVPISNDLADPIERERQANEAAGEALRDLMMRFESLGENCEFGLVQRCCGAEPLGLLRFSSTPLRKLIAMLEAGFNGLGDPGSVHVELSANGKEYMVREKQFGIYYHAWVMNGEQSPEEIHRRECSRLPFLARKMLGDLRVGEKMFVYRGMAPLAKIDVMRLASAMRQYGPTTLLWVEVADTEDDVGRVEEIATGLFKAHIKRFAPAQNAHDFSLEAWLAICRNAQALGLALGSMPI